MSGKDPNRVHTYEKLFGIIGGIGPVASCLFYQYLLEETREANVDADFIPVLIYSNTQIPNNNNSVTGKGPSALPEMVRTARALVAGGATHIALACNTAHHYLQDIQNEISVPMIDMIGLTASSAFTSLKQNPNSNGRVGILSSIGTQQSQLYQNALKKFGLVPVCPSEETSQRVQNAILRIKAGKGNEPQVLHDLISAAKELLSLGASAIITGCTEIPTVFNEKSCEADVELARTPIFEPMKVLSRYVAQETLDSEVL